MTSKTRLKRNKVMTIVEPEVLQHGAANQNILATSSVNTNTGTEESISEQANLEGPSISTIYNIVQQMQKQLNSTVRLCEEIVKENKNLKRKRI